MARGSAQDPPWLVRLETTWPRGVDPFDELGDVPIAGISRWEANAEAFIASDVRVVLLNREPQNRHDRNAIAVSGLWKGADGYAAGGPLGYLPAEVAMLLAPIADRGEHLHALPRLLFLPRPDEDKGGGVRLAIGASATVDPKSIDVDLTARPPRGVSRRGAKPSRRSFDDQVRRMLLVVLVLAGVGLAAFVLLRR